MIICGIDPGLQGAFVYLLNGKTFIFELMPVNKIEKTSEIEHDEICKILHHNMIPDHIYLERAMPMAMGSKHAFNYGRGFAAIEIAIKLSSIPVTYVEPAKWTKEMFEGTSTDMKPKARSLIAVQRLFPKLIDEIPKSKKGKLHEGVVDALLIAEYGRRALSKSR